MQKQLENEMKPTRRGVLKGMGVALLSLFGVKLAAKLPAPKPAESLTPLGSVYFDDAVAKTFMVFASSSGKEQEFRIRNTGPCLLTIQHSGGETVLYPNQGMVISPDGEFTTKENGHGSVKA